MPRDITDLSGQASEAAQITVSLLRLEIPDDEKRFCDIDQTVYLNPSTLAVSLAPGSGLLAFEPYAGLFVPEIDVSDDIPLGEVSIQISNVNGDWWTVMANNDYRDARATIYRGNLAQAPGTSPFALSFTGVVPVFEGDLTHIVANRQVATLTISAPDFFRLPIPWRTYSAPEFKHLPQPGKKLTFGYSVKEI
jgi:hypothetical protein